ncbi:MAG: WD40/YVTN/BNR-like repeat-containing protein [Planctomycetota bacterium]
MLPGSLIIGLSLLTAAAAPAQTTERSETEPLTAGWENITEKLWTQIPGYRHDPAWYNRRVGTVYVDNTTGDLYVMLCGKWGTWRSSDCGQTWAQVDATALGRQVENRGVCPNPITGDFVLFKVSGGPATQSALVLDHGRHWSSVSSLGDGFRCGMADWGQKQPTTLLAVRHHYDGPSIFLSLDAGKTWTELPHHGGYGAAMLDADTLFFGFTKRWEENVIDGRNVEPRAWKWWVKHQPKDIMLTTDRCRTFTKVAEFAPRAETPTRYKDDLFWIAAEGVMVTRDRGRSWKRMGKPIQDLMFGPFFGSNKDTMVVVSKEGFFQTSDAGENWTKIAGMLVPAGQKAELGHPGWDPIHQVIYLGFLGDDVYRLRLNPRSGRASTASPPRLRVQEQ